MFFVARCTIDPGIPWHPLASLGDTGRTSRRKKAEEEATTEEAGGGGSSGKSSVCGTAGGFKYPKRQSNHGNGKASTNIS